MRYEPLNKKAEMFGLNVTISNLLKYDFFGWNNNGCYQLSKNITNLNYDSQLIVVSGEPGSREMILLMRRP